MAGTWIALKIRARISTAIQATTLERGEPPVRGARRAARVGERVADPQVDRLAEAHRAALQVALRARWRVAALRPVPGLLAVAALLAVASLGSVTGLRLVAAALGRVAGLRLVAALGLAIPAALLGLAVAAALAVTAALATAP